MLQRVAVSLVILAAIIFGLQFFPTAADGADKCPFITVTGVAGETKSALFSANITSLHDNMTYNWTVSAGTIENGQGSLQIAVAATDASAVTATVEVGGIPAACPNTASGTVEF
jgi:PKD-like domain